MLETENSDFKDTVQESKTSFFTSLLKTESFDNNHIKVLYEFLLSHGFESTAKTLINEANSLGFKFFEGFISQETISEEVCDNILQEFNGGNWRKFFKLWDDCIPESIKLTMEYKVLTLKLRVHFAYLPVRSKISSKKLSVDRDLNNSEDSFDSDPDVETAHDSQRDASMNQLKEYLLTIKVDAPDYNSCIQLFGLPFLENPSTDPTLSYIFEQNWVDELAVNLKIFLVKHGEIALPDENYKPSSKHSTTSTVISTESMNNEQSELYEKNLQILDSFDLDSVDERIMEEQRENEILRFVKTPVEDFDNNRIRLIVNDRNIPFYIEELDLNKELSYPQKTEVKIKSTQTRIQGIKNTATSLAVDELSYPVKVFDPQYLLKSPKSSMKKYEEQLICTLTRYQNVHGNYQKLKIRFHELHADHQKLLHVTSVLTQALENSLSGNAVNMVQVLETCYTIFPEVFQNNLRSHSQEELAFKSEDELQSNQIKIKHCFDMTVLAPKSLDFKKIKFHLSCGNLKTKLLLLQALRWKITFSQQGERDEVLCEYINNDLLGLHGNITGNSAKSILTSILYSVEGSINILQQSAARLLNTIASLRCGRDYLSIGTAILNAVIECLNGSNDAVPDAFTYDMLLSMLQKLSLRKSQRINMIETGLVEWLILHLKIEVCKMSPYRFKYVTALLMNLSLHTKARSQVPASLVLPVLMDLLLTENQTALPYISKTLSNFLSNQQINEEGKKMGLETYLKYYRKRVSEETRQYLDFLIKVHNGDEKIEETDVGDNDNDDCDFIEDELDEDDPIKNEPGDLAGEILLASCYVISRNAKSELDKPNSDFKLQKIYQHHEIIPRFSNEINPIQLKPINKIRLEDTNFTDLLRNESQIEGEEFSNPRNSSTANLNYSSSEQLKRENLTTLYQPQFLSINSEQSQFLNLNSERNFKNNSERSSKSKTNSASNFESKSSKNTDQSSAKEEIDTTNESLSEFSKESSKMNTTSSSSFPSVSESLLEGPNDQSSIASVEVSAIKKEEEEAFHAKPKIQRTPPQSAKLNSLRKLKKP